MPSAPSYLGLYRSGLTSPAHRRKITVARSHVLTEAVGNLRACADHSSKHHMLFIGPRGVGKTHLLSLIEDEIAADVTLAARCVVARFPEESHRTLSFADFLLGLCEILQERLPEEPQWRELHQKLATEEDNTLIVDTLEPALQRENREHRRTLVIMLENINEMFTAQIRHQKDIDALRQFFVDDNGCLLIATSPMHFEGIASVKEPFHNFFDVQFLELLDKEQAIDLIRRNLEWDRRHDLLADFPAMRPKLMALHQMTGGSPRLTLMLYSLIAHDSVVEVRQQFLLLLDQVTPFYQDRLRDMSPQERAVLETMATMRGQDKTPSTIAAAMRMSQAQTSALLKRLTDSKYLLHSPHPTDKRSRLYVIREGFFDLWLAMNLSRSGRLRLPMMVDWLAKFYAQTEEREQKRRELREKWGSENAREALDLFSEMGPPDERARAKLDLVHAHAGSGNHAEAGEYLREARLLPLDPMGKWIVQHASDRPATNYLDEMQAMLDCWSTHRSGELEVFVEKLRAMGKGLTLKTFSETKLAFLRDHLSLVESADKRLGLRNKIGNLLFDMARWKEAEVELRTAVEEASSKTEANKWLSTSLNNLAHLFQVTDRLAEAEPLVRQALAIDEGSFGVEHPNVATTLNNLAQLLQATDRLSEAESLMRRALAIDEASFGNDHPEVAINLSNLAGLLHATGRFKAAEPLIRRALAIDEARVGSDHPTVATRLNNLAQLLQETGRLAEAEPLMRRAVVIDEATFGNDHPEVAINLSNLAGLLQDTNRPAEAEPLMRRALAIDEASFGKHHPRVAIRLNNLALLLQATKRFVEAEPMMKRQLEILFQSQRDNEYRHPRLLDAINNYQSFLQVTGLSEDGAKAKVQEVLDGAGDQIEKRRASLPTTP